MRGREKAHHRRRMLRTAAMALAALLALGVASPAVAKKKKSKPAVTATASTPISAGSQASATASCPSKTHTTGGGWSLSDPYSANGTDSPANDTGTRITHLQSQPSGLRSWASGAAALALPATSGTFTSIARCESKAFGKTVTGVSGTSTTPVGQESTVGLHCSSGTHVLSGGFSYSPAGNLGLLTGFRPLVVESRRRDAQTWEIDLVNPVGAPGDATLSVSVLCELNQKGASVTERSAVAPITENGRTSATATCTGKTHTIGGGFLVSPKVGPAIGIDQMQPVGAKGWQVGLYEYPGFSLPAGSALGAYSYCKKNAVPKKK
jgi:hypothetical protein